MIKSIPKKEFEAILQKSKKPEVSFTLEEAMELMEPCALKLFQKYPGMWKVTQVNDFIHDCVLHFTVKKYLAKFDGRTSKIYFLFTGMKHLAIDMLRHSNHVVKLTSEKITKDEMGLSIYDLTPGKEKMDPIGEMIIEEALEVLSRKDPLKKTFKTEEFGTVTFCEFWVMKFHMMGYDRNAMSGIFGVTTATIGNYLKSAQNRLQEWIAA